VFDPIEKFAGNDAINEHIHRQLQKLSPESAKIMAKKIRDARNADTIQKTHKSNFQLLQAWRELCIAEYFIDRKIAVECESQFDGKTPDWYAPSERLVIEVISRGAPNTMEAELFNKGVAFGRTACKFDRIANAVKEKADKYEAIINNCKLRYVIAVHGSSFLATTAEDCKEALVKANLSDLPHVSGVLFLSEDSDFKYFPNPKATTP
jgi:hypothetical protein